MNENFEEGLSVAEREALNSLRREKQPPRFLEGRVVEKLKEFHLLQVAKLPWRRNAPRILVRLAASLLIFVMGALIGANWSARSTTSNTPRFMILLKAESETSRPRSSDEILRAVEEYSDWARQLRQQGVRVEGEKLKQEVRMLGEVRNQSPSDDQLNVRQQRISGYFLIDAQNYEQAVSIATGCPHLRYGGTIEIRQIDRF